MLVRRDIIILAIAIICGLLAFVIVANILKKSAQIKHQFVAAAKPLAKGQLIESTDLVISKPIESANPTNFFLQLQDVAGNEVIGDIVQGELVQRTKVRKPQPVVPAPSPTPVKNISLPVPPGKRAFAMAAVEIENLPEDLKVGNFVDILGSVATFEGSREMRTVIRGAQVISIDRKDNSEIKSVTTALTPTGAEMVAKTMTQGKLRFIVAPDDSQAGVMALEQGAIEIIRGVDKEQSSGRSKPQEATPEPPKGR